MPTTVSPCSASLPATSSPPTPMPTTITSTRSSTATSLGFAIDRGEQLREDLRDLAYQIVAVRAGERPQILPIPAPFTIRRGGRPTGQRRHLGHEVGIEEERVRQPLVAADVAHPVRGRAIPATGHPVEHVTDVADERALYRRRVDPAVARLHLQPTVVVLAQQGQQPVVGVFADSPVVGVRWSRRVVK